MRCPERGQRSSWPTVRSLPGIAAVKVVLLLNVVDTLAPLNSTTVELKKLPPVTVRVALLSPAFALVGEMLSRLGAGLRTVKGSVFVGFVSAGSVTMTETEPPEAKSLAGMVAVNCVLLTKVVVRGLPFQFTWEPVVKPLPSTVSV